MLTKSKTQTMSSRSPSPTSPSTSTNPVSGEHARLSALFATGATRSTEWRMAQLANLKANFEKHERDIYVAC